LRGGAPTHIHEKKNVKRTFLFDFSGFLGTRPDRMARRTDTLNGFKRRCLMQGSALWDYINNARHFLGKITQKPLKFDLKTGVSSQIKNVE
jgi:hypothetical protein